MQVGATNAVVPIVSAVISFFSLGFGVAGAIYKWQMTQKGLTRTSSWVPLPEDSSEVFKQSVTGQVVFVVVRLTNTGRGAIARDDFETPLKFSFGARSQILWLGGEASIPEGAKPEFERFGATDFGLRPLLLNRGDEVSVGALVVDPDPNGLRVKEGRIRDTPVKETPKPPRTLELTWPVYAIASSFAFLLISLSTALLSRSLH